MLVITWQYTGGCSLAALTLLEPALRVSGEVCAWPALPCLGALFGEELRKQALRSAGASCRRHRSPRSAPRWSAAGPSP